VSSPFLRLAPLDHDLARHYPALRAVANRRTLERSALWADIRDEVARVVGGVERGDAPPAPAHGRPVRVCAWNVQRGARFDALRGALAADPVLSGADVLLLTEIDCGLGRSGNRNVARELAAATGMSYAFAPSYLTLGDDWGENRGGAANTTALAGTAILSRAAIRRAENVGLPELRDKFSSSERRLGKKGALLAELELPSGPLLVGACHLDSNASPRQRARQLAALLDRLDTPAATPAIVPTILGGDFNASTHDLSSAFALVRDVVRKLVYPGFRRSIAGYMTPERRGERPLFELLAARGFAIDGFNDLGRATYHYDVNDPYALEMLRRAGGRLLVAAVRRLLGHWNACLPARLDWFAGRGLGAVDATVVDPRAPDGRAVSDHAAIVCDLAV
jgi:endonuclease/exonuclease/phosphatase family metal-dependent hydrolase